MENFGLSPQQLLAIKGLLSEGKIHSLFAPVAIGTGESTAAARARPGGKASEVNTPSRSGVSNINAAINHDAGSESNSSLNGEENSACEMYLPGNLDDTKKFSARELLEKAGKGKKASQAQQVFRVSKFIFFLVIMYFFVHCTRVYIYDADMHVFRIRALFAYHVTTSRSALGRLLEPHPPSIHNIGAFNIEHANK